MNRIKDQLTGDKKICSIYFTAGFPELHNTVPIINELVKQGVDMIEIGLPFSDPLADGPVIQESSTKALKNGMHTDLLFQQLNGIRDTISIPLLIMGYFNPIYQYGVEAFCKKCAEVGIDGLILPDLPPDIYREQYKAIFEKYHISLIFLITPQTTDERIREIDRLSDGFIYMVSTASTTGKIAGFNEEVLAYFKRVSEMGLQNPLIVGFGIHDALTFTQATRHTSGAIIGSAFIRHLSASGIDNIPEFIKRIR